MATAEGTRVSVRPAVPLTVPFVLALTVWGAGAIPLPNPSASLPSAYIRSGSATELAPAIRAAPRAMIYVKCAVSTPAVIGLQRFEEIAQRSVREHPEIAIEFFVIDEETDKDSEAWGRAFHDGRLDNFGHQGSGWLLWFENGRLREVESHSGEPGQSSSVNWERTRSLWP